MYKWLVSQMRSMVSKCVHGWNWRRPMMGPRQKWLWKISRISVTRRLRTTRFVKYYPSSSYHATCKTVHPSLFTDPSILSVCWPFSNDCHWYVHNCTNCLCMCVHELTTFSLNRQNSKVFDARTKHWVVGLAKGKDQFCAKVSVVCDGHFLDWCGCGNFVTMSSRAWK